MENGSICFGENSVPHCSPENIMQVWQLFWDSAFNQDSVQGKSKSYPENVRSHLQQLHNNKSKRDPTRDLVPWGNKTITTAIEQIIS